MAKWAYVLSGFSLAVALTNVRSGETTAVVVGIISCIATLELGNMFARDRNQ